MKIKILNILLILIYVSVNAQNITRLPVVTGGGTHYVPVYDREGTVYIAVIPLADALKSAYQYDPASEKLTLNFPGHKLFITARNPFLVLYSDEKEKSEIFQLPTSTYLIKDQIYIPLEYSLDILRAAAGTEMVYKKPDELLVKDSGRKEITEIAPSEKNNSPFDISGISIEEKANGTLVHVSSGKRIYSYNSSFKDGVLTIIFRNVHADVSKIDKTGGQGLVKWIKAKNIKSDTELKFGLSREFTTSEVLNVDQSDDLLIALHNKIFENHAVRKKEKAKWQFNVIVIDPGHGGKDSGTIGVDGIKEKDINLAIALKLGKDIREQMKGVKVVFTRKTDKFVELYRRGQIANEAGGNLFISIHCNATPKKPSSVNGFEVYLLRPGRTKEAISIAERENSVIKYEDNPARYKRLTDENFILVSMAQSAYMRYSEKFADILDKEFSKDISIEPLGVRQAGFYVLVGASMPSVLVETGFLSNRHDARYLNSRNGQAKIAESITKAIEKFRSVYEKNIEAE